MGEGKLVFAAHRAEDRADAGLVFHSMESKLFGIENARVFKLIEVNDSINVLK